MHNNKLIKALPTSDGASWKADHLLISWWLWGGVCHQIRVASLHTGVCALLHRHRIHRWRLRSSLLPPVQTEKVVVEIRSSSLHCRSMYEDSRTVKSWVKAVYYAENSETTSQVSDDSSVVTFVHPAFHEGTGHLSTFNPNFDVPVCLDNPSWLSDLHLTSYDDSDDSENTSAFSDDHAQYIRISSDSPWYQHPESRPEPTPSPEFDTGTFPNSCSSGVRQVIAQQELLLAIFHAELQRMIPHDGDSEYNPDWLDDVDPEVLLSPMEVYEDLCWRSAVSDNYATCQLTRPLADVPIGFGDVHVAF